MLFVVSKPVVETFIERCIFLFPCLDSVNILLVSPQDFQITLLF